MASIHKTPIHLSAHIPAVIGAFVLMAQLSHARNEKILALGKETFASCSLCHGPDGKGAKAGDILMAPNLHDSMFIKSKVDPLVAAILKGIHKEDNKHLQQMVALETVLTDEQVAAVSTYVRTEFAGRDNIIKPSFVKKIREQHKSRAMPWKREELVQMAARVEAGRVLSNIEYSIYHGKWDKLPDFSTMEPEQRGEIKSGQISLNVVKNSQRAFGAIFEGDMTIKHTDAYEFSLWSMDAGALIIDGENVILNEGKDVKKAIEKLEAGEHTFKVHYLFKGSKPRLGLSMTSKKLGEITLSDRAVKKAGRKNTVYPPIILKPENGEAIVHRAFLPNEKPRAIGVGYPGEINLSWNADTLNLAHLWRGGFMDVAPHWNHRGSSSKPLGEAPQKPAMGFPFQILTSLDQPWIPFSEGKIKYERDTADPKKEIKFDIEHPDYQYVGYRLDEKRFPTFYYTYRALEISDVFTPTKIDAQETVVRTLTLKGAPDENLYFRISDQVTAEPDPKDPEWIVMGSMAIRVEGAELSFRQSKGKKEVLALISGESEIKITYRWLAPMKPVDLKLK